MTTIFLGEPPADIKKWIEDHAGPEPVPTAPDGKVLYRTTAGGEWLECQGDFFDGEYAGFAFKSSAVELILPSKDASGNDVTSMSDDSFWGCSGLTSVTIPDSVTSIPSGTFEYCSGLTSVTFSGKDKATVQGMENYYSWQLPSGCVLHCTDGDITI